MLRTKSLAAYSLALLLAVPFGAAIAQGPKDKEDPPSIEAMLKVASTEAVKSEQRVKDAVRDVVKALKGPAIDPERTYRREREKVILLGPAALPVLVEAFAKDENAGVLDHLRQIIVALLAEGKDSQTIGALIGLARGEKPAAAVAAVDVLGQAKDAAAIPAVRDLARQSQKPQLKAAALRALGRLADPEAIELFQAGVVDGDKDVRRAAVECLAALGRSQDVKAIVAATKDSDPGVVQAALLGLGGFKESTDGLRALHEALKSPEDKHVLAALDSLGRINNPDLSKRYIHEVVLSKDSTTDVRRKAARVLLGMNDTFGVDKLAEADKKRVERNGKDFDARAALGNLYFDFELWKIACDQLEKAVGPQTPVNEAIRIHEKVARCYSRQEKFQKAADYLLRTGRQNDWSDLKNDPDFKKMAEDRRWSKYFDGN